MPRWRNARHTVRVFGAAVLAHVLAGAVVGGLGARLAMRLIALGNTSHYGETTHENAVVGITTLAGTLNLVTQAAFAGISGALLYLLVRRWLPGRGWRKGVSFGVVLTSFTFNGAIDVTDYEFVRYVRPTWAYLLFGAVFYAYAIVAAALTEWIGRGAQDQPRWLVVRFGGWALLATLTALGAWNLVLTLRSVGSPLL